MDRRDNNEEQEKVENFGLGERTEKGNRLVDFSIANTAINNEYVFQKHPRRLVTCTSSDGKIKNQIDHIMIRKR